MAERSPDPVELASRLRLATARLARLLRQEAGSGLPLSQHSALVLVEKHGPLSLGALAHMEQVTAPTITRIVGRLADDGLVTRTSDTADRRSAKVSITAEGQRRLEHTRERRDAWLAERLRSLSVTNRQDIATALEALETLSTRPDDLAGDRAEVAPN